MVQTTSTPRLVQHSTAKTERQRCKPVRRPASQVEVLAERFGETTCRRMAEWALAGGCVPLFDRFAAAADLAAERAVRHG